MRLQFKPIIWEEPCAKNNHVWVAETILGTYTVGFDDGWWGELYGHKCWDWEPEEDCRSYSGPYAAQQACEQHFKLAIQSALI